MLNKEKNGVIMCKKTKNERKETNKKKSKIEQIHFFSGAFMQQKLMFEQTKSSMAIVLKRL